MAKTDAQRRTDVTPPIVNGELVPVASVVQITHLTVAGPYEGDFQIVNSGRLIVGEYVDVGARVVISQDGLRGWNNNNVNTFSLWTRTVTEPSGASHSPGDMHLGNMAANYLQYLQSTGTLGLYTPQGAGFIARRDGTLQAGLATGAHMLWNATDESLQVRYASDVKINLGADGNASFDGTIYANGGRIYGTMAVDDVLRAGDVDGPAVYMGKFTRDTATGTVETSEIIATDESNMPWFHVVAGGETLTGYFHLGGTGDYAQHLSYDGGTLEIDGTIRARDGVIGGWVISSSALTSPNGDVQLDSTSGISLDVMPSLNVQDARALRWVEGASTVGSVFTTYVLPSNIGTYLYNDTSGLNYNSSLTLVGYTSSTTYSAGVTIRAEDGDGSSLLELAKSSTVNEIRATADNVKVTGITKLGDGGSTNYAQFASNGSITFNGTAIIEAVGPSWKPLSDSTTALQLQNAAGAAIVTLDTTNKRVGIGATPGAFFDLDSSAQSIGALRIKAKLNENTYQYLKPDGSNLARGTWDGGNLNHYFDGSQYLYIGSNNYIISGTGAFGIAGGATFALNNNPASPVFLATYGGTSYATATTTLTSIYPGLWYTFAWDGSNGYSVSSSGYFRQTQLSAVNNSARFDLVVGSYTALSALNASGNIGIGETNPTNKLSVAGDVGATLTDAATNSASQLLLLGHNTSGTPAKGFGSRILWELESSTTASQTAAALDVYWEDATHATRTSKAALSMVNSAAALAEVISFASAGVIVNDGGNATTDLRVETDTETDMLLVDASADLLYLGGTTNGIKISKGGDLTLLGTATYERHVQIPVTHVGSTANQPTPTDVYTAGGDQYPTTGTKYGFVQWEIPDDWNGTDVIFEIDWLPDSGAISGTSAVRWTVEYRSIAEGELINQGSSVTLDNGAGGDTADYSQYQTKHTRFTLAFDHADQPLTKQDHVFLKVSRDTGVTNDFGGSVTVTAYEIIYNSTGFPTSN